MNLFKFLKEVFVELKNTKWYTGRDLYNSTILIIILSISISLILFGIDVLFQKLLLLVL
jgi:preprotein translocase SecE subunit